MKCDTGKHISMKRRMDLYMMSFVVLVLPFFFLSVFLSFFLSVFLSFILSFCLSFFLPSSSQKMWSHFVFLGYSLPRSQGATTATAREIYIHNKVKLLVCRGGLLRFSLEHWYFLTDFFVSIRNEFRLAEVHDDNSHTRTLCWEFQSVLIEVKFHTHWWQFSLVSWFGRSDHTSSHRPLLKLFGQTSCLVVIVVVNKKMLVRSP